MLIGIFCVTLLQRFVCYNTIKAMTCGRNRRNQYNRILAF